MPPHSFTNVQASPERGEQSYPCPEMAQRLHHSVCSRESCSSSGVFPDRGRLLYIETSAAFPSASGPLFPPGSGDRSQVAHRSAADIKVREERRIPVETSVLLPAGIGVFSTLLILVASKCTAQRSTAIQISPE